MLVLTRHKDEQIIINNGEIIITVIGLRGDKVRIGIDAPREFPVHRGEVQAEIDGLAKGKLAHELKAIDAGQHRNIPYGEGDRG